MQQQYWLLCAVLAACLAGGGLGAAVVKLNVPEQQDPALPPRESLRPNSTRPFVFFDQRSVDGGGWLLRVLSESARAQNLTTSLPCFTVPCEEASKPSPRNWNHEVLAGHLPWGHIFSSRPAGRWPDELSCVTIFAMPVNRIVRCTQSQHLNAALQLADLTGTQARRALTQLVHDGGTGCINEPVRLFSGYGVERDLIQLYKDPELASLLMRKTKEHLSQCLILLEDGLCHPQTDSLLQHWFPWLQLNVWPGCAPEAEAAEAATNKLGNAAHLAPEHVHTMKLVARLEFELFDWAQQRFLQQVEWLRNVERSTSGARNSSRAD